jgi:protein-tyrosine phosphatase
MNNKILFICTGNYYRSRHAELYFNALAVKQNLNWEGFSRGLATELAGNIGPIAPKVIIRLKEQEIRIDEKIRNPIQLDQADLQAADLVIALNEPEHRKLMQQRFPAWADRIIYWQVADLDLLDSKTAFSMIENNITLLISQLSLTQENEPE